MNLFSAFQKFAAEHFTNKPTEKDVEELVFDIVSARPGLAVSYVITVAIFVARLNRFDIRGDHLKRTIDRMTENGELVATRKRGPGSGSGFVILTARTIPEEYVSR